VSEIPSIDNVRLPKEIVEELKSILRKIPDDDIIYISKFDKNLSKGISARPKSVPLLRSRLIAYLDSESEMKPIIREALAGRSLNQEFVTVLSFRALEYAFNKFLAIFGEASFLTALILDERNEVRRLALDFIERGDKKKAPCYREQAIKEFQEKFEPFLVHIASLYGVENQPEQKIKPSTEDPGREEDKRVILSLTEENKKLQQELKKNQQFIESQIKKKTNEIKRLSKRIEDLGKERENLKKSFAEEKKKLNDYKLNFDEQLDCSLKNALQEKLVIMRAEIEQEKSHLRKCFNNVFLKKAFIAAIKDSILALSSYDDIIALKDKFESLNQCGILGEDEKVELTEACNRWFRKLMEEDNRIMPPKILFEDGDSEFAQILRKKTPHKIFLDGYNILHLLQNIFFRTYKDGAPKKESREHLVELLKKHIASYPFLQVLLFFDGTSNTTENILPNLTIIYASEDKKSNQEFCGFSDETMKDRADRVHIPPTFDH